ncbi:hypothetical protein T02_5980 [Trichinella nativa]|uniref:Uncharacterized protein n=1 Tax=Trichinella nativa TaxID=6335 RepID=A0A0V1L6Z7_9BILA|nr:hypothetical protein T02_5980 [Trichinella nativa]
MVQPVRVGRCKIEKRKISQCSRIFEHFRGQHPQEHKLNGGKEPSLTWLLCLTANLFGIFQASTINSALAYRL